MCHAKFVPTIHRASIMAFMPATVVPDFSSDPSEETSNIDASLMKIIVPSIKPTATSAEAVGSESVSRPV